MRLPYRVYPPVFKSIKSLDVDCSMNRCHSAAFQRHFNEVSHQKLFFHVKKYKKEKMKGKLSWMTKYRD